jgi:hypothetical protein
MKPLFSYFLLLKENIMLNVILWMMTAMLLKLNLKNWERIFEHAGPSKSKERLNKRADFGGQ